MDTLQHFQQEGKIGGIGFSEIAPASLRLAHAVAPVSAVQSEYSLWSRQPDLGMVQACGELGVAFVAFSPLGRGVFGAQPPDPASFGEGDFRKANPRFYRTQFLPQHCGNRTFQDLRPGHGHNADSLGDRLAVVARASCDPNSRHPVCRAPARLRSWCISATHAISPRRDRANPPGRVRPWCSLLDRPGDGSGRLLLTLGITRR